MIAFQQDGWPSTPATLVNWGGPPSPATTSPTRSPWSMPTASRSACASPSPGTSPPWWPRSQRRAVRGPPHPATGLPTPLGAQVGERQGPARSDAEAEDADRVESERGDKPLLDRGPGSSGVDHSHRPHRRWDGGSGLPQRVFDSRPHPNVDFDDGTVPLEIRNRNCEARHLDRHERGGELRRCLNSVDALH
jgi:hypothetical protein